MELHHLRYFVAVAEERHFGRAASRLGLTQPPLSYHIRNLESELHVQLLERNSRHVRLTPAGRAFLDHARRALDEVEKGSDLACRIDRGEVGQLRLGYKAAATSKIVPKLLAEYRRLCPHVKVIAQHVPAARQVAALRDGDLDIGILVPPIRSKELDFAVIQRESFVAVLPTDHPLAVRDPIPLEALSGEQFVIWPRHATMHDAVMDLCRQSGFIPSVAYEARSEAILLSLVAEGVGIAILPGSIGSDRTVVRQLTGLQTEFEIAVAWRRDDHSASVRSFVALARTAAGLDRARA